MFFSKSFLLPIALLGCASFLSAQAEDDMPQQPKGTDLVAAYPNLSNAREEVLTHQTNLTLIFSSTHTTAQAHEELTECVSDLKSLTTALTNPPPPFLANTGPGKVPTQDDCSLVFVDIINALVQINLSVQKVRPVAPSLHTDVQAIAAETVAALKAADAKFVITRKAISEHVDVEGIFHMHDGYEKIAMFLTEDQVNKS